MSEQQDRTLQVAATRLEGTPMHLRQQIAEAKGEDFTVEIASNLGPGLGVVVIYKRSDWKGHWVSYVLPARALVDAVLAHERVQEHEAEGEANK